MLYGSSVALSSTDSLVRGGSGCLRWAHHVLLRDVSCRLPGAVTYGPEYVSGSIVQ